MKNSGGGTQGALSRRMPDPPWLRRALIAVTVTFLAIVLVAPLLVVIAGAAADGWATFRASVSNDEARAAIRLTVAVMLIVTPLNLAFGLAAAVAVTHQEFPGRSLLITLIDLPFAISPVVSGLIFILLFGLNGAWGGWLEAHGLRVIFATPGIVLATAFVTVPFVARELIPLANEQGREEEVVATGLGAGFWQTFRFITVPKLKWGILYGVVLVVARAIGEFGAVSVVSGHIRGQTTTIPLHIEMLYNEYDFPAAFAMASILMAIALCTIVATTVIETLSSRSALVEDDRSSSRSVT